MENKINEDKIIEDLYTEQILEEAKDKSFLFSNENEIKDCIIGNGFNPSCGDSGSVYVVLKDSVATNVKIKKDGCAISQASMNIIAKTILNKNIKELKLLTPGNMYTALKINITPARSGCALLGYNALLDFLKKV